MENERAKVRVPTHLDAILVIKLSFIPGRCGHLECNGADRALDWKHHLQVIVGSDIEDVVDPSLAAWPEASEDRNQPADRAISNLRQRQNHS
jgi:hypothetical protein